MNRVILEMMNMLYENNSAIIKKTITCKIVINIVKIKLKPIRPSSMFFSVFHCGKRKKEAVIPWNKENEN